MIAVISQTTARGRGVLEMLVADMVHIRRQHGNRSSKWSISTASLSGISCGDDIGGGNAKISSLNGQMSDAIGGGGKQINGIC